MDRDKHDNVVLPKMLTTLLDQHHDAYFIKGLDSSFIYANQSVARKVGLRSPRELLNKTEKDLQSRLTENEEIIKEWQWQDSQVISLRKKISTLEINPKAVDCPYIVRKLPFYNEKNRCVGVLTYCRNLQSFRLGEFVNGQRPGSFLLTRPSDFFTDEECEIVFLNLQGQTEKSIASRLFCSVRFVEEALLSLYNKAGVKHFDDFSDFCQQQNYHRYLPKRFIENETIMFEDNIDFLS